MGERKLAPRVISFGEYGTDGVAMRFEFDGEDPLILVVHRAGLPGIIESLGRFLSPGVYDRLIVSRDGEQYGDAVRAAIESPAPPPDGRKG